MQASSSDTPLLSGLILSGERKGQEISWEEIKKQNFNYAGVVWLHFDFTHPKTRDYLSAIKEVDSFEIDSLLGAETRPRATLFGEDLVVNLRGINTNPGADPEDMVSIRMWFSGNLILTTRRLKLLSVDELRNEVLASTGPENPGDFLTLLSAKLIDRMQSVINEIEDKVAEIEEQFGTTDPNDLRGPIATLRRQAISLKRYLKPQKEALEALLNKSLKILSTENKLGLSETLNHLNRYIEELDSLRDRAAVTQEELAGEVSEQLNNRMFVLSIVAALFLPLGFLTGLLGINVGGIPGSENESAFAIFTIILIVIVVIQVVVFRHKKWF